MHDFTILRPQIRKPEQSVWEGVKKNNTRSFKRPGRCTKAKLICRQETWGDTQAPIIYDAILVDFDFKYLHFL